MTYTIFNKTTGEVLVRNAAVANTFLKRIFGLIRKKALTPEEGLIFYHAPSIHMFFMKFPIDVVFLDKNMAIIKICRALKPWKLANCFGSSVTIEIPAGKTSQIPTKEGDILEFIPAAR
jgi:uncharacterized membrane protein (UPF0127 family)